METSAKTSHNVKNLFKKIGASLPVADPKKDAATPGTIGGMSSAPMVQCFRCRLNLFEHRKEANHHRGDYKQKFKKLFLLIFLEKSSAKLKFYLPNTFQDSFHDEFHLRLLACEVRSKNNDIQSASVIWSL